MAIAATPVSQVLAHNHAAKTVRAIFEPFAIDLDIVAADTASATLVAAAAGYTIFVTSAVFNITTAAAQTLLLADTSDTPVPIFKTVASATGSQDVTFGEDGTGLTPTKGLTVTLSAAGLAGRLHVEGYRKPIAPRTTI